MSGIDNPARVHVIAGARPNFVKIAPIMEALASRPGRFAPCLIHTGQHYDAALSKVFFDELGIPRPDKNLEVGSGSHAQQTAEVMKRYEPLVVEGKPDLVIVVGDVNSTIACALVASKLGVKVAHVEAGLRSFDRSMPEEINRVLTDAISDLYFVSEPSGLVNLAREGAAEERIHFVGNVMIDSLKKHRERARASKVLAELGLEGKAYAVLTLHRPANVDEPGVLGPILRALEDVGRHVPIVFPAHPRTVERIRAFGLGELLSTPALRPIPPQSYLDFLKLQSEARVVLTDSGGVQEETTVLGVPCVTLRDNTERPVTVERGTNVLAGNNPARIAFEARRAIEAGPRREGLVPPLWDGFAASRIVDILERVLPGKGAAPAPGARPVAEAA